MLIRVVDIETSGLSPPHGIVEIASLDILDGDLDECLSRQMFANPGRPIPPEAACIHHIMDEDVVNAASQDVAINSVLFAEEREPDVFVSHVARFERQWLDAWTPHTPWICTYKSAMRVWPESPSFGNQFLRYYLKFGRLGPEASPPHRALPDCVVTALLFNRLMSKASVDEMIQWQKEPAAIPRVTFGKHKGQPWTEPEDSYYHWVLRQTDQDEDVKWIIRKEMERRMNARREEYVNAACIVVAAKETMESLVDWFRSETDNRVAQEIIRGTTEFERIVDACTKRKAELAMETAS